MEPAGPLPSSVQLPQGARDPILAVARRLLMAVALIAVVAAMVRIDNEGYRDANGDGVSTLDAFYYATVSVTTTGYGDIVPTTNNARLLSTSIVTIARIIFLVLLVSTTFEVATQRGRDAIRLRHWRRRLKDHTIICGFGAKGQSAAKTLLAEGHRAGAVVVIDVDRARIDEATSLGLAGIQGDATRTGILKLADAHEAAAVVVATDNDAVSVLVTLTARELNKSAVITAAVREDQNAHLLRQGGANSVIVSSEASGRLLGLSTHSPALVALLEELLLPGHGLDMSTRRPRPDELGGPPTAEHGELIMAIERNGKVILATEPVCQSLEATDQVFVVHTSRLA